MQAITTSLEKAKKFATMFPSKSSTGVLVGKKTFVALDDSDISKCCPHMLSEDLLPVASSSHSIFMPTHGYNGMLYRVGEFALVEDHEHRNAPDSTAIIRISNLWIVRSTDNRSSTFIKGEVYPIAEAESPGDLLLHIFSDNPVVFPTKDYLIIPASKMLRKLMLYPDPANLEDPSQYVVIDYVRPKIPLKTTDVIVPYWPEKGEMVFVDGDGGETWLGHVQKVDINNKLCHLHFYVKTRKDTNLYQREQVGHRSLETVNWTSIRGKVRGVLCGKYWKLN